MTSSSDEKYVENLDNKGDAIPVDEDVDSYEMKLPEWFDPVKYRRAQKYFKENGFSMFIGKLCGLIVVLAIPSITKIFLYTKKTDSDGKAFKRYLETILHVLSWYDEDLTPTSRAWKSLAYARRIHAYTSKRASTNKVRIISQKDMALVQYGFFGFIALKHKYLGVHYDKDDMEAFIHFWRVIGHMQGIHDEYNLCTDSVESSLCRLQKMNDEVYMPALTEMKNDDFDKISHHLVNGLWCVNPILNHVALVFFLKRMVGVSGYGYWKSENPNGKNSPHLATMTTFSRIILFILILATDYIVPTKLGRWLFNSIHSFTVFLIYYFPVLAMWQFGFSSSYIRVKV